MRQATHNPGRRPARAFTLVELLVVIGIIMILLTILVPLATRIQSSARSADAAAQLNAIRGAIEAYHNTFGSYPGPLPNTGVGISGIPAITGSENLALGLFGGLYRQGGTINYDRERVGGGVRSLTSGIDAENKTYTSFVDNWVQHLGPKDQWGQYGTAVPELRDRHWELPILYLRAKRGATGVAADDAVANAQYSLNQISAYVSHTFNRHDSSGRFGLRDLGGSGETLSATLPNNFIPYIRNPVNFNEPRAKDTFILISVGQDRLYGTADDITSFGSVMP